MEVLREEDEEEEEEERWQEEEKNQHQDWNSTTDTGEERIDEDDKEEAKEQQEKENDDEDNDQDEGDHPVPEEERHDRSTFYGSFAERLFRRGGGDSSSDDEEHELGDGDKGGDDEVGVGSNTTATIGGFPMSMRSTRMAKALRWITYRSRRPSAEIRLLCFPWAGGTHLAYSQWEGFLPHVEVIMLRLPGRLERTDDLLRDFPSVVSDIADALIHLDIVRVDTTPLSAALSDANPCSSGSFAPDLPLAMFGHELGALLAFEVTRELERRRDTILRLSFTHANTDRQHDDDGDEDDHHAHSHSQPTHALFVSGMNAPQLFHTQAKLGKLCVFDDYGSVLHALNQDFQDAVCERGGLPEELVENEGLLRLFIPQLAADLQFLDSYEYEVGPRLKCPILAAGGALDGNLINLEGWGLETECECKTLFVPGGGPFYLRSTLGRTALLRAIQDGLALEVEAMHREEEKALHLRLQSVSGAVEAAVGATAAKAGTDAEEGVGIGVDGKGGAADDEVPRVEVQVEGEEVQGGAAEGGEGGLLARVSKGLLTATTSGAATGAAIGDSAAGLGLTPVVVKNKNKNKKPTKKQKQKQKVVVFKHSEEEGMDEAYDKEGDIIHYDP